MKKISITALIILLSVGLIAETSGEYGLQVLKIISGADDAAMAGTGSFYSNSAFRFINSPAAGSINNTQIISFNQNYWIFDTTISSLSYLKSSGKSSFGIGYRFLDYGTLDGATDDGTPLGEFHPMDLILTTGFGYRFTPSHYLALNINGLYEKIDTESATGASIDFGYRYLTPVKGFEIASALKNLGKTTKMTNEELKLPITGEVSFIFTEFNKYFGMKNIALSSEIKLLKYIDDDEVKANIGIKALVRNNFNLKLGYKFNHDSESFSTGFGVTLKRINLDYAFVPFNDEIDDVHMLQLSFRFK